MRLLFSIPKQVGLTFVFTQQQLSLLIIRPQPFSYQLLQQLVSFLIQLSK